MHFIILDLQDIAKPTLSDLRALHYAYFIKGAVSLTASRRGRAKEEEQVEIVPLLLQPPIERINGNEILCKELNIEFSSLDCAKLDAQDIGTKKKAAIIERMISTLCKEYHDARFSFVCQSSNEFHFKCALGLSSNVSLDHFVPVAPVFSTNQGLRSLTSIQKVVYDGLVEKIIGSADGEITRLLAESKGHILFYTLKKTKRMDLDLQCETNEIGIHLQYSIARIEGIKSSLKEEGVEIEKLEKSNVGKGQLNSLFEQFPKASTLYNLLQEFDGKLEKSVKEPSVLVAYASNLSKLVSSLYYHLRVKGENENTQIVRWNLFVKSLKILQMILTLFHCKPIEKI